MARIITSGSFTPRYRNSFRFWKTEIYLQIQYSGGLGITEPGSYAYYITNSFSLGATYLFQWKKTWIINIYPIIYNAFKKPSHDFDVFVVLVARFLEL